MPDIVYVATYQHKYDTDVRVFATQEAAERWRQAIANEWWDNELDLPDRPTDPTELADVYFDKMMEWNKEFFSVYAAKVEQ